jgi:hypothetical protein
MDFSGIPAGLAIEVSRLASLLGAVALVTILIRIEMYPRIGWFACHNFVDCHNYHNQCLVREWRQLRKSPTGRLFSGFVLLEIFAKVETLHKKRKRERIGEKVVVM